MFQLVTKYDIIYLGDVIMEQLNRLFSYLTKNNLVSLLSIDEHNKGYGFLYAKIILNVSYNDFINKLTEYIDNSQYEYYYVNKDEIIIIDEFLITLKISIVNEIVTSDYKNIIYNVNDIKPIDNLNYIANMINNSFICLNYYIHYYKANDYITAFNYLSETDNYIIKYLFSTLLEQNYIGKLKDLFDVMTLDKKQEFLNYHKLLEINKMVECSKMMIWFLNDYIISLPITIAKVINLDFYLSLKKEILNL